LRNVPFSFGTVRTRPSPWRFAGGRAFLDRFDQAEPSPARLRELRAVELLEGVGTPAAEQYLAELAQGAAGAPLTREAAAALGRLERRQGGTP
jgi:hypothetical protein